VRVCCTCASTHAGLPLTTHVPWACWVDLLHHDCALITSGFKEGSLAGAATVSSTSARFPTWTRCKCACVHAGTKAAAEAAAALKALTRVAEGRDDEKQVGSGCAV